MSDSSTSSSSSPFGMIVRRSLVGGLLILLPMVIVGIIFRWLYDVASGLISPFTGPFIHTFGLPKVLADLIVVALLVLLCFLIGTLVEIGRASCRERGQIRAGAGSWY